MRNVVYNPLMAACKACHHERRDEIDRQIVGGVSLRLIVASTGLSLGSLHRHKLHVKQLLTDAMRVRESESAEHSSDLLNRVEKLLSQTEEILTTCKAEKNFKSATAAIAAATRLLELLGKLDGSLVQSNTPGLRISLHTVNNTINVHSDDVELAQLICEATNRFDPLEIDRLKQLAMESATGSLPDGPPQLAESTRR